MNLRRVALSTVSAPLCAALHAASFPPGQAWDEAFFKKLLDLPSTRGELREVDDSAAGFVLWQQEPDRAEIYTLAVLPGQRRQNIATLMLTDVEAELLHDGVKRIVLDVATDNPAAIALYQKHGYAEIARRKAYYARAAGAVDAIVMEKVLEA